jgi:hypothetical protein
VEVQSLIGLNTNITVEDQVFHVQTEDLGRQRACIVTHVFSSGGQVIRKVRFDYSKHLGHPNLAHILPRAMQTQHVAVMQRLRAEGAKPDMEISRTDLPCVHEEELTPSPDLPAQTPRSRLLRLDSGVWDYLVAQAKSEKDRKRAMTPAIPLPDANAAPMALMPPEVSLLRSADRTRCWNAAIASARREYEATLPVEPLSANESAARRAFDEATACLHRDEREAALVWLCKAALAAPKDLMFRARLSRLLSQMEDDKTPEPE